MRAHVQIIAEEPEQPNTRVRIVASPQSPATHVETLSAAEVVHPGSPGDPLQTTVRIVDDGAGAELEGAALAPHHAPPAAAPDAELAELAAGEVTEPQPGDPLQTRVRVIEPADVPGAATTGAAGGSRADGLPEDDGAEDAQRAYHGTEEGADG